MVKAIVRFDYPALKKGQRIVIGAQSTRIFRTDEVHCRDSEDLLLHDIVIGSGRSQLKHRLKIEAPVSLADPRIRELDTCMAYLPMSIEIEATKDLPEGTVFLRGVTTAVEPFDLTRPTSRT